MKEFWNARYGDAEYAYGTMPNAFLKQELLKFPQGKILFPAEGEGRNAIFATKNGFEVDAFDISEEGKIKATKLADENNVAINYQVGTLDEVVYGDADFDYLALIFAHFPADLKSNLHQKLSVLVKKGGIVIFEAFSKRHLEYQVKYPNVGGPKDLGMLFSKEEIIADFSDFEVLQLEEKEVTLDEGIFHQGVGSVVRFIGKKK